MQDIDIVPLQAAHLAQAGHWAERNTAIRTLLKLPRDSLRAGSGAQGWSALSGDETVAIAIVTLNPEHVGYLDCIVKPGAGRQGIGTQLMEYVLSQPFVKELIHLHAIIDPANTPAFKVLEGFGFTRTGYNQNGYVELARHSH
jgi:ribosomal protein S18 acetylase RimI-like enzyme